VETVPSLAETIVLDIIDSHQPISGYQIRKIFAEITSKNLSFGTLVPMLHRFEKTGLVVRARQNGREVVYLWSLTPFGLRQLDTRLSLLARMLRASSTRRESSFSWQVTVEKPLVPEIAHSY
jgi:DNA-binding PadR family transcriptional regulator